MASLDAFLACCNLYVTLTIFILVKDISSSSYYFKMFTGFIYKDIQDRFVNDVNRSGIFYMKNC